MTPHIHRLTRLATQLLSKASTYVLHALQDAAGAMHGLWKTHQELMDDRGVYRAVVTSLTGLVGRQLNLEQVILTVVSALIRHHTGPSRPPFGSRWDGYPDDPDDLDGWPD